MFQIILRDTDTILTEENTMREARTAIKTMIEDGDIATEGEIRIHIER